MRRLAALLLWLTILAPLRLGASFHGYDTDGREDVVALTSNVGNVTYAAAFPP